MPNPPRYTCGNCDNPTLAAPLESIRDLASRIDPGGTVPAGECTCGALLYLDTTPLPERRPMDEAIQEQISALRPQLHAAGVKLVDADYSGSGDEGAVNYLDARSGDNAEIHLATELRLAVEGILDEAVSQLYDGYYNDSGGGGVVRLDVDSGELSIRHHWYQEELNYEPTITFHHGTPLPSLT